MERSRSRSRSPHREIKRDENNLLNASHSHSAVSEVIPKPPQYTFQKPYLQSFSIPERIVYYLAKNPSNLNLWTKLSKTCKYFYSKNQVVGVGKLEWDYNRWKTYTKEELEENDSDIEDLNDLDETEMLSVWKAIAKDEKEYIIIDSKSKISEKRNIKINATEDISFKLWIDGKFEQPSYTNLPSNAVTKMLKKVFLCNLKHLSLGNQKITFDDYLFLTSTKNVGTFDGSCSKITYLNGEIVPFEKIMAQLPKVIDCVWGKKYDLQQTFEANPSLTSETTKALTDLPIFQNLHLFELGGIPKCFDFESFWNFILEQPYLRKSKHRKIFTMIRPIVPLINLHFASDVADNHRENIRIILSNFLITIPKGTRPRISINNSRIQAADEEEQYDDLFGDGGFTVATIDQVEIVFNDSDGDNNADEEEDGDYDENGP